MLRAKWNTLLNWLASIVRRAVSRPAQPQPDPRDLRRGQVI